MLMIRLLTLALAWALLAPSAPVRAQAVGYPNAELLADVAWLSANLGHPDLRIVDMSPAGVYAAGHVPGAVNLQWEQLQVVDTSEPSIAAWRAEVEAILGGLGIGPDHTVVVYDDGTLYGARLFWVLEQLGHARVKLLDGGFPAWRAAGLPVTAEPATIVPTTYTSAPRAELLAGYAEVLAKLGRPDVVLLDVRAPAEYRGEDVRAARGGHIPGAVNVPHTENAQPVPPPHFKSADALMVLYATQGVTPDKQVIAYCSSGVRASVGYFSLRLLGYPDVKVYTGSWDEWGNRPDLPVE